MVNQSVYTILSIICNKLLYNTKKATHSFLCFRYNVHLRKARKEGLRKSFFRSLSLALVYVALFSTFALGFW